MRQIKLLGMMGLLLISGTLLYFVLVALQSSDNKNTDCTATSTSPRAILSSTTSYRDLWSISGIPIENFSDKKLMVNNQTMLVVVSRGCNFVIAFDLLTGNVEWKSEELPQPRNIELDIPRERAYISSTQNITAISLLDGSILWTNNSSDFIRNDHSVVLRSDGQVTVSANGYWFIDPSTGILSSNPISFDENTISEYQSSNPIVSDLLKSVQFTPISNVVEHNDNIYVLDSSASLHIFSESFGDQLIAFTAPLPTELLYEPEGIGGSWVAVDDQIVAIYFQDSDVLSVYQIDLSSEP
jgi:hypothetical protein